MFQRMHALSFIIAMNDSASLSFLHTKGFNCLESKREIFVRCSLFFGNRKESRILSDGKEKRAGSSLTIKTRSLRLRTN
jgi:hypothetical protein